MYQCADCGHIGEAAISGRKERRCEACYALLTDSMVFAGQKLKATSPAVVSEKVPAEPPTDVSIQPANTHKPAKTGKKEKRK